MLSLFTYIYLYVSRHVACIFWLYFYFKFQRGLEREREREREREGGGGGGGGQARESYVGPSENIEVNVLF